MPGHTILRRCMLIKHGRTFNPIYQRLPREGSEVESIPPPTCNDGLCENACLMIDKASMNSVLAHIEKKPGYMVAVDAESEQWTSKPGAGDDDQKMVHCEFEGTMKVHFEYFLTEFLLRSIKDGVLTMGETHGKPEEVWSGVGGFGEDQDDDEGRQEGSEEGKADTEDNEEASEQN
jgi:hypothetical protein